MIEKNIYESKIPLRILFVFMFIFSIILAFATYIIFYFEIDLGVWSFAIPLLSVALLLNSFSGEKIKRIWFNEIENHLVIEKQTLFKSKSIKIDKEGLSVMLLSPNKGKWFALRELNLRILENDNEVEEMNSSILSLNNFAIRKTYNLLKEI